MTESERTQNMSQKIWNWIDKRTKLGTFFPKTIPKHSSINPAYCLGGITFLCFIVSGVTGVTLAVHYQPNPEQAYNSIGFIMSEVPFGSVIRNLHRWSANAMIFFCILHMIRVFFSGAYKSPRELNWIAGTLLLFITLGFGFSGYLLPWDEEAFLASNIGITIAATIPYIGPTIARFLMAGERIAGPTLARFYAFHLVVFPIATVALLVVHFYLVKKHGIARPL
ncbi:MAG: cytochrome b N-terminal domain-containing protein [Candidatus Heimdallarchaeota archaeon]